MKRDLKFDTTLCFSARHELCIPRQVVAQKIIFGRTQSQSNNNINFHELLFMLELHQTSSPIGIPSLPLFIHKTVEENQWF